MSSGSKSKELVFHADRVKDVTIRVLQSVALDPRISPEEKLGLLSQIAGVHVEMAEMIHASIEQGVFSAVSALTTVKAAEPVQKMMSEDYH